MKKIIKKMMVCKRKNEKNNSHLERRKNGKNLLPPVCVWPLSARRVLNTSRVGEMAMFYTLVVGGTIDRIMRQ